MNRFVKGCLLLGILFAMSPVHAYLEPEAISITFRQSALSGSPALTNPQYGVALNHPGLPQTMLTHGTTLHFSFESTTTQGDLVFMLKNKRGREYFGLPPAQQPSVSYEEYLQVRIPLSQSGPNYRHTIHIGQTIQDANIQWGQAIYMGFFAEVTGLPGEPASSQTHAYFNNNPFGRPWATDNLRSPEFSLPVIYDKGTHPNLPSASLSEGSNSHGFTNLGTTINGHTVHGTISNYFYELEDTATSGNAFPLGDRIWELYEINTNNNNLTLVHSVPGEGNLGSICPFQVPEHPDNGTQYLLLCRTVDATGNVSMAQPTTVTDPGLGSNCFVFEVGKDVTKDPQNCLKVAHRPSPVDPITTPDCEPEPFSATGQLYVMTTGPYFDSSANTSERIWIEGKAGAIQVNPAANIPPLSLSDLSNWPNVSVGSSSSYPVRLKWKYKNSYGTTALSPMTIIYHQVPMGNIESFDWETTPSALIENFPLSLNYHIDSHASVPQRRATFWIYDVNAPEERNHFLKPLGGGSNSGLITLTSGSPQNLNTLVLPEVVASEWELPSGSRLGVRMKAVWGPNFPSVGSDAFLNDFSLTTGVDAQRHYEFQDSSDWILTLPEPGHFTSLHQGNSTNQVRLATNEIDLCLIESHTGNPEPRLAWRWETTVGNNTYLWRDGSWQPATSHPSVWMELDTGIISPGVTDEFSSRWQWHQPSGKIQPKGLGTPAPLAPLTANGTSLVAPFFTPTANNQVDTLTVTIKVRMFYPGYQEDLAETVSLSLLQPEPGIEGFSFELAKTGTTPACGDSANWLDASDYFGRLGNLPRMQFSLTSTGNQVPATTLRIEKQISDDNFTQVSCHDLNDPAGAALFATSCQNSPAIGENLQRWWVAEADTDPNVDNLFDVLANHGPGTYRIRLTAKACAQSSDSDASVIFTLNPAESFALRIHYRDHIGSSSISRAYTPSLAGVVDNTAPFNLKVGTQSLALYAQTPEWTHYEPFGKTWGQIFSEENPRFTDHEYDSETGFNFMKGRYQLPDSGRFNRPDPARDWDWGNPSSINLYQYVRNNPIDSWDPFGLEDTTDQNPDEPQEPEENEEETEQEDESSSWEGFWDWAGGGWDSVKGFFYTGSAKKKTAARIAELLVILEEDPTNENAIVDLTRLLQILAQIEGFEDFNKEFGTEMAIQFGGAKAGLIGLAFLDKALPKSLKNKLKRILNQTAASGLRGVSGTVTEKEAIHLAVKFVGPNYSFSRKSGFNIFRSADGLRMVRGPAVKKGINKVDGNPWSKTGYQVNFQSRKKSSGMWKSNVHLDVEN